MKESLIRRCSIIFIMMAAAFAMCAAMATPAFAANTPVNGGTFNFNKYLVMDANANVPNATFEFTITAGGAVSANKGNPAIYAGIGNPTVTPVSFNPGDSTTEGKPDDPSATTYKYAKKQVNVDFSSVSFNSPGIYRYIITEKASGQNGIANDTTATRTLDVHVSYAPDSNDRLVVSGYTLYPGTKTDAVKVSEENKDDGFTNTYTTNNLTLSKTVSGNQGDRDKYFAFTVEITGAVAGTVYTVDLNDADGKPNVDGVTQTNAETLTATDGTVTAIYYLKHGQSIKIQGLTEDTTYKITETDYSTDGYTTSYTVDGQEDGNNDLINNGKTMGTSDHTVAFTNAKEGTVPTGILLETAPYIGLGVAVIAGLALLFATRRRRAGE